MNKTLSVLALSVVFGLTACQQQKTEDKSVPVKLETQEQKNAYALGANIGNFIDQQATTYADVGIELDRDLLIKGVIEGAEGKSQLTEEEVQQTLHDLQVAFREGQNKKRDAEAEKNKVEGAKYLEENMKREGVVVTDSGLQYEVLVEGDGEKPAETDTVKVHYHGTLIDGTVFDSSVERGQPATFPLNRVITGWTEGVQLMPVGSKYRFHIPSDLAYGDRLAGKITPFSTLIFEVELLSIEASGDEK
ncbi:FKBP-type peptidyl-prolyl cis-trans isomerase [Alteromonas sp. a30]|nr:FKBP-type peptidyl-prolyl cis-trans isomerase [Alteromonas sp. a30]